MVQPESRATVRMAGWRQAGLKRMRMPAWRMAGQRATVMVTIPAVVPRPRSRSRFWSSATSASEVSLPATEAKARSTPMTTTLLRIGA